MSLAHLINVRFASGLLGNPIGRSSSPFHRFCRSHSRRRMAHFHLVYIDALRTAILKSHLHITCRYGLARQCRLGIRRSARRPSFPVDTVVRYGNRDALYASLVALAFVDIHAIERLGSSQVQSEPCRSRHLRRRPTRSEVSVGHMLRLITLAIA